MDPTDRIYSEIREILATAKPSFPECAHCRKRLLRARAKQRNAAGDSVVRLPAPEADDERNRWINRGLAAVSVTLATLVGILAILLAHMVDDLIGVL